jgi:hypothetical protein
MRKKMHISWKKLSIILLTSIVLISCYSQSRNKSKNTLKVVSCNKTYLEGTTLLKAGVELIEYSSLSVKYKEGKIKFNQSNSKIELHEGNFLIKKVDIDKNKEYISFGLETGKINFNCLSKIKDVYYSVETPVIKVSTTDNSACFTVSYGEVTVTQGSVEIEELETGTKKTVYSNSPKYEYLFEKSRSKKS